MKQRSNVRNDQNALLLAALHLCYDLQAEQTRCSDMTAKQQTLIDKMNTHFAKNGIV